MSGFVPLKAGYIVSVRKTRLNERRSLVDPGISRGVTDLYPVREYIHPVARAIEVSHLHAACKAEFDRKSFWSISQLKCIFSFW